MKHGMLCEASHDLIVIDARIPLRQKSYDFRLLRRICGSLPSNLRGSDALVF